MFQDPAEVPVNGVTKYIKKVNQDGYSSEYRLRQSDREFRLNIRNSSYADRRRGSVSVDRHNVELIEEIFPVAPATRSVIRKCYFVLENDRGDTLADPVHIGKALCDYLAANSGAALTLLTNFES